MQLTAESERLVHEAIQRGDFRSIDEIIAKGLQHPNRTEPAARKTIYELLTQPPFAGAGLQIERQREYADPIDLG